MSQSLKLCNPVNKMYLEGTVSQNFDLGPTFHFIFKKRETFNHFLQLNILDFIKKKI